MYTLSRNMKALLLCFITQILASNFPCPGGKHKCSDQATCCQLPDLTYGCCPEVNAVCCDDHIHCCPEGSRCDGSLCIQSDLNNSIVAKNMCPGGESSCPDQSTCCMNPQGKVSGCCLMPDATCCADGQHCCPKDFVCDLDHFRCVSNGSEMMIYRTKMQATATSKENILLNEIDVKHPAKALSRQTHSIICPGGSYQCPDGYTCCRLTATIWGCCPYPDATCCQDNKHCCPSGMKCDKTSQSCIQGHRNITWFDNLPAEFIH